MKKLLLALTVIAFTGIVSVPVYSFVSTNPTVVLDDPPTTKQVSTTEATTETTKEATTKKTEKKACKSDYKKECSKKDMSKSSCCKKDKK